MTKAAEPGNERRQRKPTTQDMSKKTLEYMIKVQICSNHPQTIKSVWAEKWVMGSGSMWWLGSWIVLGILVWLVWGVWGLGLCVLGRVGRRLARLRELCFGSWFGLWWVGLVLHLVMDFGLDCWAWFFALRG